MGRRNKRLQRLERECAVLAAQAKLRLAESAVIRQGGGGGEMRQTPKSAKETLWISRERGRIAIANHLKNEDSAEEYNRNRITNDRGGPMASQFPRPQSASPGESRSGARHQLPRRPSSADPDGRRTLDADVTQIRREMAAMKEDCRAAWEEVSNRLETEKALRATVELLRGRLHAQTQREIEHQRRLQLHARLEPVFDRLAEKFVFKNPEEVVDRLEFLENDKLGTMDLLLRARLRKTTGSCAPRLTACSARRTTAWTACAASTTAACRSCSGGTIAWRTLWTASRASLASWRRASGSWWSCRRPCWTYGRCA
ncbi:unnamed protein product [Ostreobium quekettii]|uniref:Uncharacterized protein n=1 Tax=Ostreobium quekettii TaxID=121088 RepID=A0A8S1IYY6_9CHLO|nr:unnamed protein product [Ostreobium quekettii]